MKYKVDPWNNFCRVFEVPEKFPTDYCFGRGHLVNFRMVDWFQPLSMRTPSVSKKIWEKEVGPIETVEVDMDELAGKLIPFVKNKQYIRPDRRYLILCDFGGTFAFEC